MSEIEETSLEQAILSEFECPVCKDYVSLPIRQCCVGHIMCNSCFVHLDKCPICRGALIVDKAHIFENLYQHVMFPCQYKDEGCTFVYTRGELFNRHQKLCVFGHLVCPMNLIEECEWKGYVNELIEHCEIEHPEFLRKGASHQFTLTNSECGSVDFFQIFQAHGEIFVLFSKLRDGAMKWYWLGVGIMDDLEKFDCEIKFPESNHMLKCSSFNNEEPYFYESYNCLDVDFNALMGSSEEINFDVRAFDRGLEFFLNNVDTYAAEILRICD